MNVMEQLEKDLVGLNLRMLALEVRRDLESLDFFAAYLADLLVFSGVDGNVCGKYGQTGFMQSLRKPSEFVSLSAEACAVNFVGPRALVTLTVAGTSRYDGSQCRYRSLRLFSYLAGSASWRLELWHDTRIG